MGDYEEVTDAIGTYANLDSQQRRVPVAHMTWADLIARGVYEPNGARMRYPLPHGHFSFASFTYPGWVGHTAEIAPNQLRIYWRNTREPVYAQVEYWDHHTDFRV